MAAVTGAPEADTATSATVAPSSAETSFCHAPVVVVVVIEPLASVYWTLDAPSTEKRTVAGVEVPASHAASVSTAAPRRRRRMGAGRRSGSEPVRPVKSVPRPSGRANVAGAVHPGFGSVHAVPGAQGGCARGAGYPAPATGGGPTARGRRGWAGGASGSSSACSTSGAGTRPGRGPRGARRRCSRWPRCPSGSSGLPCGVDGLLRARRDEVRLLERVRGRARAAEPLGREVGRHLGLAGEADVDGAAVEEDGVEAGRVGRGGDAAAPGPRGRRTRRAAGRRA